MPLSTTYTKVETDFLLQQLESELVSGLKGSLKITDAAPTAQGLYILSDVGTYTNLGGIVTTAGKLNYAYFDGTTWSKVEVDMPQPNLNNLKVYFVDGVNLFNSETAVSEKYLDTATGAVMDSPGSGFFVSDFIKVDELDFYTLNSVTFLCFYDVNKVFISGAIYDNLVHTIKTPANTAYLRFSANTPTNIVQVEKGSATTLKPFKGGYIEKYADVTEKIIGVNKFDKSTILKKYYLSSGVVTPLDSGFWVSEKIYFEKDNYKVSPPVTFIASYDENDNVLTHSETNESDVVKPVNGAYFRISDNSDVNVFQVNEGTEVLPFDVYKEELKFERKPKINTILLADSGDNYNVIRTAISNISDASEYNIYHILVPKGRFFECDLIGKEFVKIIGLDLFESVIYCDGLSTKITPTDYSFSFAANQPLNTIEQRWKHVINMLYPIHVENCTIEATNNIKYCAHIDNNASNVRLKCRFILGNDVNYLVGIGSRGGQTIDLSGSVFVRADGLPAILFHNTDNQRNSSNLILDESYFKGCAPLLLDELNSGWEDWVSLKNCDIDDYNNRYINLMVELPAGTNPLTVPYCIRLNNVGTTINVINRLPFEGVSNPRPDFEDYVIGKIG